MFCFRLAVMVISVALLSSCVAAQGRRVDYDQKTAIEQNDQLFASQQNASRLFVIGVGGEMMEDFYIDGRLSATVFGGEYADLSVAAGQHEVSVNGYTQKIFRNSIKINMSAGATYFIQSAGSGIKIMDVYAGRSQVAAMYGRDTMTLRTNEARLATENRTRQSVELKEKLMGEASVGPANKSVSNGAVQIDSNINYDKEDDKKCLSYGAKRGSQSYVTCRIQLEGSRSAAQADKEKRQLDAATKLYQLQQAEDASRKQAAQADAQAQQLELQRRILIEQKNASDLQALQVIQGAAQSMQPQQPPVGQGVSGKSIINCNTARVGGGNLRQTTCY